MIGPEVLALGGDVAVDELDDRDRRGVGGANAGLDDPAIAAIALGVARGDHVEQLGELDLVHQPRLGEATVRQAAVLGQRDQLLDIGAKLLRLGRGGGDLFVLDERGRHVAEQGRPVARGALKLTSAYAMAHGSSPFVRGPCEVTPARRALGSRRFPEARPQAELGREVKVLAANLRTSGVRPRWLET